MESGKKGTKKSTEKTALNAACKLVKTNAKGFNATVRSFVDVASDNQCAKRICDMFGFSGDMKNEDFKSAYTLVKSLYPYITETGMCAIKRTISGETAAKYFAGQQFAYYVSAKDNVALIRDAYIVATKLASEEKALANSETREPKDIATLAAEYATNRVAVNVTSINDYDDVILYAYRLDGVTRFVDDSTLETQYRNMLANKRNANKAGTEARKAAEAQGIVAINGTPEQK
jgi:nucleotide-binding universal stress UspA family protein